MSGFQKRFVVSLLCSVLAFATIWPSSAKSLDNPVDTPIISSIGVGFVGTVEGGFMNASTINDHVLGSRLEQMRSSRRAANASHRPGAYGMTPEFQYSLWASPFVTRQRVDERGGYAPYRYKAVGSALGYDRAIGDFTLGGAFAYSRGRYNDKWVIANDNVTDNYALVLYGSYSPVANLFVDGSAGYQYGRNKYKRYLAGFPGGIGVVDGDYGDQKNHTGTWWVSAKAGYDFAVWRNLTLTPSAGLEHYRATGSAFTSYIRTPGVNNASAWMEVEKIGKSALIMPLDLYASYTFDINPCSSLSLRAGGGWDVNLTRKAATGSMRYSGWNRKVDITGAEPGRSLWKLGMGAKYRAQRFDVSLDYRYDGGWKKGYAVSGALEVKF